MFHFCTYFDSNYLLRGLSLYRSLLETNCEFTLYVLAMDERTAIDLRRLALPRLQVVTPDRLEAWRPTLAEARGNRSRIEYYFTLSPLWPLYLLEQNPDIGIITYLDADLCFYASPQPLYDELGSASILITEHRFPEYLADKLKYGRYNVQYQSFRSDEHGMACLELWAEQCLEWCYDYLEGERYADQKYLEQWPERYSEHLVVSQLAGAGLAPWNWASHHLTLRNGQLYADDCPLIFYHFHGLKLLRPWLASNGLKDFGMMPWRVRHWLYLGYVRRLRETRTWLRQYGGLEYELRDNFVRHKIGARKVWGEVLRKAWAQSMLIY